MQAGSDRLGNPNQAAPPVTPAHTCFSQCILVQGMAGLGPVYWTLASGETVCTYTWDGRAGFNASILNLLDVQHACEACVSPAVTGAVVLLGYLHVQHERLSGPPGTAVHSLAQMQQ